MPAQWGLLVGPLFGATPSPMRAVGRALLMSPRYRLQRKIAVAHASFLGAVFPSGVEEFWEGRHLGFGSLDGLVRHRIRFVRLLSADERTNSANDRKQGACDD